MLYSRYLHTTVALIAMVAAASPASAQAVGTAGAVNPASTGTPPGGAARTIEIGTDVVFQERIRTTGSGAVQVLFVDRTALTVGPNSDVTIDEFVYNPNAGTGSFVASLAEGSLRFVGGQISRNSGVTINTPTATIGIRGSVVGVVDFGGGLKVTNYTGRVEVQLGPSAGGASYTLPPGNELVVNPETQEATVQPASTIGGGAETNTGTADGGTSNTSNQNQASAETAPPAPVFVPDQITPDPYFQEPPPPSPPPPDPDPEPIPP